MNSSEQNTLGRRDLAKAITLRPADVFSLYGIPTSTTSQYCNDPDPERRMPSLKIPGRRGRKGIRLINHDELKTWLSKWKSQTSDRKRT